MAQYGRHVQQGLWLSCSYTVRYTGNKGKEGHQTGLYGDAGNGDGNYFQDLGLVMSKGV